MNVLKRFIPNVFSRNFYNPNYFKATLFNLYRLKFASEKLPISRYKLLLKFTIGSTVFLQGKLNVEDDLRVACQEGEAAILNLMDQLHDLIIEASKEYRNCLTQQIELMKKATNIGPEAWDELPKFRTLASELNNELSGYLIILKTIGEIAYEHTMLSALVDEKSIEKILKKYKELEILLLKEFQANKQMELELLEVNVANIMSDIQ